jgi:hypothetical protein
MRPRTELELNGPEVVEAGNAVEVEPEIDIEGKVFGLKG